MLWLHGSDTHTHLACRARSTPARTHWAPTAALSFREAASSVPARSGCGAGADNTNSVAGSSISPTLLVESGLEGRSLCDWCWTGCSSLLVCGSQDIQRPLRTALHLRQKKLISILVCILMCIFGVILDSLMLTRLNDE